MESWQPGSVDGSEMLGANVPYNPNDWEDWLRWDPTAESLSPYDSSKDSADSPVHDMKGDMSWLGNDATLAPPLVVGDDASMLDMTATSEKAFDFGDLNTDIGAPFVFGNNDNIIPQMEQNLATDFQSNNNLWPATEVAPDTNLLSPNVDHHESRRASTSTSATNNTAAQKLSPQSQSHSHVATTTSSMSPPAGAPPKKRPGRKRKAETEEPNANGDGPVKKTSHNVIEKRYRNNLNDKILELRDSVPSLRAMSRPNGSDESEDLEGLTPAHKLNKSTVMAKATEYIKHLEKRNQTMGDEIADLKARLSALEKSQAKSSATQDRQFAATNGNASRSRQSSTNLQTMTMQQPMMQQPQQQQYMQQHAAPTYEPQPDIVDANQRPVVNARGGNGVTGKLMVGSMAGLMVLEGFNEHDQNAQGTSSRGLYATPLHLFKRSGFTAGPAPVPTHHAAMSLLKLSLLFGAVLYIVLPLFKSKPRRKTQTIPTISLTRAESLASPVETRRKAWLTAIQSVWTPRPFLLEVVAVGIRMLELSLRRIVGFERYAETLGMTKDDEAARIKAWDIAIDAQLAGGDAEVSYYRLLLTLMASGTLPDSPIRLMQKAVHFRIFFWEIANAGYGNLFMFKDFTAKVAKVYWDSARAQHKALASGNAAQQDEIDNSIDRLPDHLASLIELDCDEVLTDGMIQRAYNLAWNRPSSENTMRNATLDSVVEDHAIRSPLDAIAGWFANTITDEALGLSIHDCSGLGSDIDYLIDQAIKTAPPASATHTRALVARAILIDEGREASITAALVSMPSSAGSLNNPSTMPMNVVDHAPSTPDIRTALTLAKILSIASSANPASSQVHAASALEGIPVSASSLTLLTVIATHKVLEAFSQNAVLFSFGERSLDGLATSLRTWAGTRASRTAGLSRAEKGRIVSQCLNVAKRVGGWKDQEEIDSGYGSAAHSRRGSNEVRSM
ncbi:hypothetical protein MBLNU457_g1117t1 [Dothideomycetes sp. NU457]